MALTPKQERFVQEYLVDLNATQAAIRAGYSRKTADVQGSRLLGNVKVQAVIQEAMKKRAQRTEITQERVMMELAAIAFASGADYKKVVSQKGVVAVGVVPTESLTASQRAAISEIRETQFGVDIKLGDKMRALELLGKHLGMFMDKQPDSQDSEVNIIDDV